MHASPAPPEFDRMLQVEHFVVEDVFDRISRHARVVEDAADDDCVVSGIVVAEAAASVVLAPGKLRTPQESVEEAAVEVVEDFFQMVMVATGGAYVLASAHLADKPCFGSNVVAGDITAITSAVGAIDRLTIELGEQDVRDRMQNGIGRAFQQVGDADVELSLTQPDGVIDGDERIEANMHGRRGRVRPQFAIGVVKYLAELWGHLGGRVARPTFPTEIAERQKS